MDQLEAHVAGLAALLEPGRRARYGTLLASARGREKIVRRDLQQGRFPFDPRYLQPVEDMPRERLAETLKRLGAGEDACLWPEDDKPHLIALSTALEHYRSSWVTYLLSIVPGTLALYESIEYPAARVIVHRRDVPP